MKRLLFVLTVLFFCGCENDTPTTGTLVVRIYDNSLPCSLSVSTESGMILYNLDITKEKTSMELNPGNYKLTPGLNFQIMAGHTTTYWKTSDGKSKVTVD